MKSQIDCLSPHADQKQTWQILKKILKEKRNIRAKINIRAIQFLARRWINIYHTRIYRPSQNPLPAPSLSTTASDPTGLAGSHSYSGRRPHATFSSKASPIKRRRPVHRLYRSRRPHPRERSCRRPPICPAEYDVTSCSSSMLDLR